jgi:predicted membrane protein
MNTIENKKNVLFAAGSMILMVAGGLLLNQTLTVFYYTSSALTVISLSLLSVFLYVAGTFLMGRYADKKRRFRFHAGTNDGAVFALLLVAAGMLLLGFNTGHLPSVWKGFFFSWPMLLLVAGFLAVCKCNLIFGISVAAAGKFFLLSRAAGIYPGDRTYEQFLSTYWPVLIIIFGILIFLSVIIRPRRFVYGHYKEERKESFTENPDGRINYQATFGGTEQVILDPLFKGGNIETTFGGIDLDLRRTSLAEGDTFLNIKTTFGGVVIKAPDSWEIEIHSNSFAGGVNDSRVKNDDRDKSRKLVLIAKCTFGGVEIK